MAASAGIVFTGNQGGIGDNTGRAAILDQHADFMPYIMNVANQVRQDKKLALERQRKADKEFRDVVAAVKPEATWQYAQGEIAKKVNDLRQYMITQKMAGNNPLDPYTEAGRESARMQDEIRALSYMAQDTEKKFNAALAQRVKDPYAYDAEHFNNWTQGLKGKTIAEQAEYINSSNPLKPVIMDSEVIKETIPDYFQSVLEKGDKTTDISEIREEDYRPILESYLTTPKGQAQFADGIDKGRWKNEDEYVAEMTKIAQGYKPGKTKTTFDEGSKVASSSGGGGSAKVAISSQFRNSSGLTLGVNKNVARVSRAGTQDDLPAVEVDSTKIVRLDKDGKPAEDDTSQKGGLVQFIPVEFVLGKDGKIGVRGKEVTTTIQSTGNVYADAMAGQKPTYKEAWVDYDSNKALFDAQLGMDMYDYFNQQNAGKTAAKTETNATKKFKGVPQGGF